MRTRCLFVPLALSLGLALALLGLLSGRQTPAVAALADELHVCPAGPPTCDHTTIQDAVDAANPGDVIKVATGTYTDLHVRPRKDVITTGVVTQVVYVSKTVTIQGGYTTTNWTTPDLEANPTTLDAQEQGRVLYITGDVSPTVEGLRITGGDATGLGGTPGEGDDAGGGVYAINAAITLNGNDIYSNTAHNAGGVVVLYGDDAMFSENDIYNNTAYNAGGVELRYSDDATLNDNCIYGNTAGWTGGVSLFSSDNATLSGNDIYNNTADFGLGGGVNVGGSHNATLSGNDISGNIAGLLAGMFGGGGVYVSFSHNVTLSGNHISVNTAGSGPSMFHGDYGGGVALYRSDNATLSGNEIGYNTADDKPGGGIALHESDNATLSGNKITWNNTTGDKPGGGVYVKESDDVTLNGNEIYANDAYEGGGVYVRESDNTTLDNNVIAGNQAGANGSGVYVAGSTIRLRHDTLVGGSGIHVALTSTVALTNSILVGHTTGITVAAGSTATLEATLWGTDTWANGSDWGGAGSILTGTHNYWSNPAFVSLGSWDYHISENSAAIDKGIDAGLATDIDGQVRDLAPDLGADEFLTRTCWARVNGDSTDYFAVQPAVDAAGPGDLVKVAGVCLGAGEREGLRQQVYLDKSLTIRGGYTTTNWTMPDPDANPTILDAQGQGRVLYITGDIYPTIEGLHITGGDSTGLGGGPHGADIGGGGMYIINAAVTLNDNDIYSNTAIAGGGVYLGESDGATLNDNDIYSNTADSGAGLYLFDSAATLNRNTITSNTGDGLYLYHSPATLNGNIIASNTGRGLLCLSQSDAILTNNIVADNWANLYISGSSPRLLHTTIAHNPSGDGSGVYVTGAWDNLSNVVMTNTILVSHTVGITVTEGNTVTLEATLWGADTWANASDWGGVGAIVTGTHNYWGDPLFIAPDAGDYHIGPGSAAVDKGVDAGVNDDIDGDPRPMGWSYDIGADELRIALSVTKQAWPDGVQAGAQLTYTLRVTNTGDLTLTATITDVLPEHATPGGIRTWTATLPVPGGTWTETVIVTVEMGYAGALTNVVHVTTEEGATGVYTETSLSLAPHLEVTKEAHPDPVQAGETLTYTLRVTNTGNVDLHATVTDTLPTHVTPTGILNWTPDPITPGGVWTEQFNVTVEMGYAGPLTNVMRVTTDEGATGVYTETSLSLAPHLEVAKRAHPDPVQAGEQLIYTIYVTNTGNVDLHTTITDTLPTHVTPTGVHTWMPTISALNGVWAEQVVVTVEMGYVGALTNVVRVMTKEGATGVYTEVSAVIGGNYLVYLPLVMRSD